MAAALDDFLEKRPGNRLLLYSAQAAAYKRVSYRDLWTYLDEKYELAQLEPGVAGSKLERLWAMLAPASHEPWSLLQKFRLIAARDEKAPPKTTAGYLATLSALAAASAWISWVLCGLGIPTAVMRSEPLKFQANAHMAASLIGFSQAMVAAKYYQSVLSRLSTFEIPGLLAKVTEISLRVPIFVALPTAFLATGSHSSWWAWSCAVGAALVALTNLLTYRLATNSNQQARDKNFSTAPVGERGLAGGYDQWWLTMLVYAIIIAVIAVGLASGKLHDTFAYVLGLLIVNFGVHYLAKLVLGSQAVRGGLSRAFANGVRLARWPDREQTLGARQVR